MRIEKCTRESECFLCQYGYCCFCSQHLWCFLVETFLPFLCYMQVSTSAHIHTHLFKRCIKRMLFEQLLKRIGMKIVLNRIHFSFNISVCFYFYSFYSNTINTINVEKCYDLKSLQNMRMHSSNDTI